MSEAEQSGPSARMDRRLAIKWILAAGAGALLVDPWAFAGAPPAAGGDAPTGYGTDPSLTKPYKPGDYWPLTFSEAQRRDAAALCDVIIPADGPVPSASQVGVPDFIDEWISAPYPDPAKDRASVLEGLSWLDRESRHRFACAFSEAAPEQRLALCEEMAPDAAPGSALEAPSRFFKRFRNLVAAGFFTTPAGMKDLGYVGNVPLARFEGPPPELVRKLGLEDEVAW